jgi:hypothetical protein
VFHPISVDAENQKFYLAPQIEPGSLRTLRLSFEGAASLNRRLRRELERRSSKAFAGPV